MKPFLMLKALLPKSIDSLKEKVKIDILEPSIAPYSNWWFAMPKNFEALRFIQDIKLFNKVIIKNIESKIVVAKVGETFARHAIYSIEDLYLGYV